MAAPTKALDVWTDELVGRLFFQPDNALALSSYDQDIKPDATFEVNGQILDHQAYLAIVKRYRSTNVGKTISNPTLAMFLSDDGKSGVVAQHGIFSTKVKATGEETQQNSVTMMKVDWVTDEAGVGRRMLAKLTEVIV